MFITKRALEKMYEIHALSKKVNAAKNRNHRKKLLKLAEKHIKEIQHLYNENNPHADIETGDLLVLCLELIIESGKNPDEVICKCFERYKKKLSHILKQQSKI